MELGYQSTEFRGTIALERRNAGRLAAAAPSFLRVRGTGGVGRRHARRSSRSIELEAGTALLHPDHHRVGPVSLLHERPGRGHGLLPSNAAPALRSEGQGRDQPDRRKAVRGADHRGGLRDVASRYGFAPSFFVLVADEERVGVSAVRRVGRCRTPPDAQAIAAAVDRRLGELNIEYHGKRASGRLGPLDVAWLKPGAGRSLQGGVRRGRGSAKVSSSRRCCSTARTSCCRSTTT